MHVSTRTFSLRGTRHSDMSRSDIFGKCLTYRKLLLWDGAMRKQYSTDFVAEEVSLIGKTKERWMENEQLFGYEVIDGRSICRKEIDAMELFQPIEMYPFTAQSEH